LPADPGAGAIIIDHHSGIGRVPRQDPEIVFPRTALAKLATQGIIGELSPFHFSFMGGVRRHEEIEKRTRAGAHPRIAASRGRLGFARSLLTFLP